MSFHPTLDWIVSVYFKLFYKRKLDWGASPWGFWGCYVPSSKWFIERAWVKGQSLLLKCVDEIRLFSDLRKLVFLFPVGLIVPDSGCSLSLLICSHKPKPETLIGSDDLYRPTTASTATLPSSEEHVNFNKVIKVWRVWNQKPQGISKSRPFCKGYSTAALIPKQLSEHSCHYTVMFVKEKTFRE